MGEGFKWEKKDRERDIEMERGEWEKEKEMIMDES